MQEADGNGNKNDQIVTPSEEIVLELGEYGIDKVYFLS